MYMTLEHRKSFYPFNFKPDFFLFVWNILENIFCRVFAKHFILLGDSKLQCQKKRTFEPFWILSIFKLFKDISGTCRSPVMSVDNINVFRFVMVKNQLLCDRSLWLWIKLKDFFPLLFTNRVQKSPPASEEELHPIMRKNTRIFGHFRVWLLNLLQRVSLCIASLQPADVSSRKMSAVCPSGHVCCFRLSWRSTLETRCSWTPSRRFRPKCSWEILLPLLNVFSTLFWY